MISKYLLFLLLFPLSVNVCFSSEESDKSTLNNKQTEEQKTIVSVNDPKEMASLNSSFERYKKASIDKDGETLATLITQESTEYYKLQQDRALHLEFDALNELSVIDLMHVLVFRLASTPEELKKMPIEDLLAIAIHQRLIGGEVDKRSVMGEIEIKNDYAVTKQMKGSYVVNDIGWKKIDNTWHIDSLHFVKMMESDMMDLHALQDKEAAKGKTIPTMLETAYAIVEVATGIKIEPKHLKPLIN